MSIARPHDLGPAAWERDAPLATCSGYRTGGTARWLASPASVEEFQEVVRFCRDEGVPRLVLGGGTNTLIADGRYDGVIVSTQRWTGIKDLGGGRLRVRAGSSLRGLIGRAVHLGYAGLQGLIGIPGTVGGAIWGNAGGASRAGSSLATEERWISRWVESLIVLDEQGRESSLRGAELPWGYRFSGLGPRIVLEAILALEPGGDAGALKRETRRLFLRKEETQPLRAASAGCVFRNPPGESAGRLIERAGLKGSRIGGALVSERHANFIVNDRGATSRDIEALIERVRRVVRREHGIELEREIIVTGGGRG